MKKAVFLDRDGVINRALLRQRRPHPPETLAEVEILPGVVDACAALSAAGFFLAVITNQPDVARGTQSREMVEAINRYLAARVHLDDFQVCYHDNSDDCHCRKPKPGLITDAAAANGLDIARSYVVGDRWRDIVAGQAAGCRTIWIDYGYDERQAAGYDFRAASLLEASQWILQQEDRGA